MLSSGATLVLGGARSGKSVFAEQLVESSGLRPVYIATGQALDAEMGGRIAEHQGRRGGNWQTVEAPLELVEAIAAQCSPQTAVLVDCLNLWVTNLMMADHDIDSASNALCQALAQAKGPLVLVSSEVGLGIVPDNAMARAFRDHAGRINQRVAGVAKTVYLVAAGLPLVLKS